MPRPLPSPRLLHALWLLALACLCALGTLPARAQDLPTLLGEPVTQVAAGGSSFTCALTQSGAVYCWGWNSNRELGNGSTTHSALPTAVLGVGGVGTLTGVAAITAGINHACALTTAGAVVCWGSNDYGRLGDGSTAQRTTPVAVMNADGSGPLSGIAAISAGGQTNHTCALTTAGTVLCWGNNSNGQLGDGSTTNRPLPVAVKGLGGTGELSGVAAIAVGWSHTCALTQAGAALCWGNNGNGQLGGGGGTGNQTTPVAVQGLGGTGTLTGITSIVAGAYHTCAVTQAGAALCWGNNGNGQLGDGSIAQTTAPVAVKGVGGTGTLSDVTAIAAGNHHTCARMQTGAAQCWGANGYGQLGDGSTTQRPTPVAVPSLGTGVAALTAGPFHTCALAQTGTVQCWGSNYYGPLGNGTNTQSPTPTPTAAPLAAPVATHAGAVAAGANYTCALTTAGAAYCWGGNGYGQLGDGSTDNRTTPAPVSGLGFGVAAIAARGLHTCALTTAGTALCWGHNGDGQLGDGSTDDRPTPVAVKDVGGAGTLSGVAAIAAGNLHTCALTTAGTALCWGHNGDGRLGDGSGGGGGSSQTTPVSVSGLGTSVNAITAGGYHTCALTTAGTALCWGANLFGQLGNGNTAIQLAPVSVKDVGGAGTLSGVAAIAASTSHTCALTTTGAVQCWGSNTKGKLGDGSTAQRTAPVDVKDVGGAGTLSGVAAIATGDGHTCARTTAGAALCWGYNSNGQLGDGSTTDRSTPVAANGLGSGVAAIAAGAHTCALTTAGAVQCWGWNYDGQAPAALLTGQALAFAPGSAGTPLPTLAAGQSVTLATGTAGTTYGTWTPGTCTVTGTTLTATAGSLCGVWAAHAGTTPATAAAASQMRLLQITQAAPTLALAGPATGTLGQSVTFTATLADAASPTGAITFTDGAATLCTVSAAPYTCTATLAAGAHAITATYAGDASNAPATSNVLSHAVSPVQPTLGLAGPASSTQGQTVTFTATLTGGFNPTGDIVLTTGGTPVCTITLPGSTCAATLPLGTNSVVASFAGDTNNAAATSSALAHTVNSVPVPVPVPEPEPEPNPTTPTSGARASLSPGQAMVLGDSGAGGTALHLPQAVASGNPATVTLPNGTALRVSGGAGSVLRVVRLPGSQYALALDGGHVELAGASGLPLLVVAPPGSAPLLVLRSGACGGPATRIVASTGSDGSTQVTVASCHAILDNTNTNTNVSAPRLYAGEQARWGAEGQLQGGSARLVAPEGGSGWAGEPMALPPVPGLTVQAVPRLNAAPQRTGERLLTALLEQVSTFGLRASTPIASSDRPSDPTAWGSAQSSAPNTWGSLLLSDAQGGTYSVALLGAVQVDIDGTRRVGAGFAGNGALTLTRDQLTLTLSPGVPDLPALVAFVRGLGGSTTLQSDGVLRLQLQGNQFVAQPGYAVERGSPGMRSNAQGHLTWADDRGRQQTLYPVAADFARVQSLVLSLDTKAQVQAHADGTIGVMLDGQPLTLRPDYALEPVPVQHLQDAGWLGSDGRLYVHYPALGLAQGFDVQ